MKFLVTLILTMLLGYLVYLYNGMVPWWGAAVGAFLAGSAVPQKAWHSWMAGFTGMLLLWVVLIVFISQSNQGILAGKMAQILPFGGNTTLLVAVSGLVGGLVGGFSALAGNFLRKRPN
jgi:hypothetical protein